MMNVVVIGGGIAGSSAAYRLTRNGSKVTLVDRADVGQATAAGAGILSPAHGFATTDALLALARESASFYPELVSQLRDDGEPDNGYDAVGALYIATNEEEATRLAERLQTAIERRGAGFAQVGEVSTVSPSEARRMFPALAEIQAAFHASGAARVDGRSMRDALQRATNRRGGTIERGSASLVADGDRVTTVTVNGQAITADAVILAAGAWSDDLGRNIGLTIPVHPQRGQIAHLLMPGVDTSQWPILLGFHSHYMLTFPTNRIVAGATREHDAGFDYRETAGGVHEVLGEALRIAPGLSDATVHEIRIGFRPSSPDNFPIIGPMGSFQNIFLATGFGASGLQLAPYSGALAADLALGQSAPIDIQPFSLDRFGS